MNRFWAVFIFMVCANYINGQSIYDVSYYYQIDNHKEEYRALLQRLEDGTGFIRVKFYDEDVKENIVVEMKMEEYYYINEKGIEDTTILVFEGFEPVVIKGPKNYGYNPDIFWLKRDVKAGYFQPWGVTSPGENNRYDQGVITTMNFIEKDALTRDFVLEYYSTTEPFYKNLFETAITRPVSVVLQKAKMHLVIVANTEDADIGVTCELDKKNTLKLFKELCSAEMLNIGLETVVIDGDNFSKQKVDAALTTLSPGPQDIVVFYYSGHGFNWNKETRQFPYLDLRDKMSQQLTAAYTMNVEDIYNLLLKKGARMNLVLSDCCNADPSQNTVLVSGGASQRTTSLGGVPQKCKDLFMNEKPMSLLMTAASRGELSAGTRENGGIFTYMFRETLGKFMGPYETATSWAAIVDNATKRTVKKADGTDCRQPDDSFKPCRQQPKGVLVAR